MSEKNNDGFSAFLMGLDKARKEDSSTAPAQILGVLSTRHEMRVIEIQDEMGLPSSELWHSIEELKVAGLIWLDDDDDNATIHLTDDGEDWARVMCKTDDG